MPDQSPRCRQCGAELQGRDIYEGVCRDCREEQVLGGRPSRTRETAAPPAVAPPLPPRVSMEEDTRELDAVQSPIPSPVPPTRPGTRAESRAGEEEGRGTRDDGRGVGNATPGSSVSGSGPRPVPPGTSCPPAAPGLEDVEEDGPELISFAPPEEPTLPTTPPAASPETTEEPDTDEFLAGGVDLEGVDLTKPAEIKDHLFGKVLRVDQVEPPACDQLTMELQDFVAAVREKALGAEVLAFEPNQANVERFELNVKRNAKLAPRIRHLVVAVSDTDGQMTFRQSGDLRGASMGGHLDRALPPLDPQAYEQARFKDVVVPTVRIDTLIESRGERPPDILKIDVEGAEELVLKGAMNLLKQRHPVLLIEVHHICLMFGIQKLLLDAGYTTRLLDQAHATPSRCFIMAEA